MENQKKTIIHQLIVRLKEEEISKKEMIELLADSLAEERKQMELMFDEGVFYGKNPSNFDYPFSRCFNHFYELYHKGMHKEMSLNNTNMKGLNKANF